MRRVAFLLLLLFAGGWGASAGAQTATAPIDTLTDSIASIRTQTTLVGQLLVGARLDDPVQLHEVAGILSGLALSLDRMATHAEHGQITDTQRESLDAQIEKTRLMLARLNERIRASGAP